jgi:hypothetical protein
MATLYDRYNTGDTNSEHIQGSGYWKAQTFTTSVSYTITSVKLLLYRIGSPGDITVSIRATSGGVPTGGDLTSATTYDGDTLTTDEDGEWIEFTFASTYALSAVTKYAIVVRAIDGTSGNVGKWRCDASAGYTGGSDCDSDDAGSTWTADTTDDSLFECWGDTPVPADKTYSKALVAIAGNEVWYESSAGTMSELAAANGDIDTGSPLTMVEAFQKVFIANKTNLKIADFANTKKLEVLLLLLW